jgi:hypothetical protein
MSGFQQSSGGSEYSTGGGFQMNQPYTYEPEETIELDLEIPPFFPNLEQPLEKPQDAPNREHQQDMEQILSKLAEAQAALKNRDQVDGVRSAIAQQQEAQRKVESGLTGFFECIIREAITLTAKAFITGVVATGMFSVSGPVGAGFVVAGATIALQLGEDTVKKPAQPLQGNQFSEIELLRVIENALSEDRRANEELKQFFIELQPTIEKIARLPNITIKGDVQGLIIGDQNTITETFNSFLQDKA